MKLLQWINDNKEWFLSGAGVVVITSLFTLIKKNKFKSKEDEESKTIINQSSVGELVWYIIRLEKENAKEKQASDLLNKRWICEW